MWVWVWVSSRLLFSQRSTVTKQNKTNPRGRDDPHTAPCLRTPLSPNQIKRKQETRRNDESTGSSSAASITMPDSHDTQELQYKATKWTYLGQNKPAIFSTTKNQLIHKQKWHNSGHRLCNDRQNQTFRLRLENKKQLNNHRASTNGNCPRRTMYTTSRRWRHSLLQVKHCAYLITR